MLSRLARWIRRRLRPAYDGERALEDAIGAGPDPPVVTNFGRNVTFRPRQVIVPDDDAGVVAVLNRHAGEPIRVMGSLHAWNDGVATDGILLDPRKLDQVDVVVDGHGDHIADVGAGCVLEDLIRELDRHGLMLPALGAITRQTISGAISTATHGSGSPSLSHFVDSMRIAAYGADGAARVYELEHGDALRAARCAVGAMGVVLSVRLRVRSKYWVTEVLSHDRTLDAVLRRRPEFPLQQFMLVPFAWRYVAFNRRLADGPPGPRIRVLSLLYRWYDRLAVELLPHLILAKALLRSSKRGEPSAVVRLFYRHVAPRLLVGPTTTMPGMTALTLHTGHHYRTRHVEMELFVPEPKLRYAVRLLEMTIEWSAGTHALVPDDLRADIEACGLGPDFHAVRGRYMHHYPLFFRRVLPDDTLISMTSDGATRYAIGVFTYLDEDQRAGYYAFCALLARLFVRLTDARLHWGKYFPLAVEDISNLYPGLPAFHRECAAVDPGGAFSNEYVRRVLGVRGEAGVP